MEREFDEDERQRLNDVLGELNKRGLTTVKDGKIQAKEPTSLSLEVATNVEIMEPEWIVPGWIPRKGITTLAGDGGTGKTTIWCNIGASITTGKPCFLTPYIPFDSEPKDIIVFSAEDSWNYVLKKRLVENGADTDRIHYMGPNDERFVDLNFNGELLQGFVMKYTPELVIFDPVQAFVPEHLRMGDRNAMRKCFSPLIGYGEKYNTSSLIIVHTNKQSNVWGRKRIADSSDIWDASRSVLMVGMVPNGDGLRYITHEKSNWGKLQDTILFDLVDGVPVFRNYSKKKDVDFILEDARKRNMAHVSDEAKEFIIATLQERGQMEVAELDELAKVEGISKNALKDAKAELRREEATHTWSIGFNPKKYYITLKDTSKPNEYDKKP